MVNFNEESDEEGVIEFGTEDKELGWNFINVLIYLKKVTNKCNVDIYK